MNKYYLLNMDALLTTVYSVNEFTNLNGLAQSDKEHLDEKGFVVLITDRVVINYNEYINSGRYEVMPIIEEAVKKYRLREFLSE